MRVSGDAICVCLGKALRVSWYSYACVWVYLCVCLGIAMRVSGYSYARILV